MVSATDWNDLDSKKFAPEEEVVSSLLSAIPLDEGMRSEAVRVAKAIVEKARSVSRQKGVMESFLEEFGLSNQEGLALMCLAEALLRVPDAETRDDLIAEKIQSGDWLAHSGQSDSWLVNASTWGLMLTGKVIGPPKSAEGGANNFVQAFVRESGEPVIRAAMMQAMRIMGEQFVVGRTIERALKRGAKMIRRGDAAKFSFDMLGEGARTAADATRYMDSYRKAIATLTQHDSGGRPEDGHGISVKLSALHPRYDAIHERRVMDEMYPLVLELCEAAAKKSLNLCLDAEESDRLIVSMQIFERLAREPSLKDWSGLGLAVQAYQKRAYDLIGKIDALAKDTGRRFMVRLVKGAYWDSEIKHGQEQGYADFPVFTTKEATDLSYLVCARRMLEASPRLYSQFATHNAHTLAALRLMAEKTDVTAFEFQRLHGMGEALYTAAEEADRVRVYAPVGAHEDLLPYLVRRLLENGANTSFVNSFLDDDVPVESVVADPIVKLEVGPLRHPKISAPPRLFGADRRNSAGVDIMQESVRKQLAKAVSDLDDAANIAAGPIIDGKAILDDGDPVGAPHDRSHIIGKVRYATQTEVGEAIASAQAAQKKWDGRGGPARAQILRDISDELEADTDRLIALLAREAGKTLGDAVAEVREAVDFCRYYAAEAERLFAEPERLPGPAGETNHLRLAGRGVFVAISPWNFPLAIFTGQAMAALAAGNTVVAKPAEQTSLIAFEAVKLFQKAGLPGNVLQLLPGLGETVGAKLTSDTRIAGAVFTGSTPVARIINRSLAARESAIAPVIAETGGLNAMFVDTTALREQVIDDIITSAFGSAGQRCSALRVVFLPHDIADGLVEGIKGAMAELQIGDPADPLTDVGPVIDEDARAMLEAHVERMKDVPDAKLHRCKLPKLPERQSFFAPTIIELKSLDQVDREVFGPVLHIVRYDPDEIAKVGKAVDDKGYGLTLGIHSRLDSFHRDVRRYVHVGNTYVNRSMTGAVVGVQPFGGEGLSGTGPKAGGPHYLVRFAVERTLTVNITAQGGDPELLRL